MKIQEFHDIILKNLKNRNFKNMIDDYPEFLTYASEFALDASGSRDIGYICQENIAISFNIREDEGLKRDWSQNFLYEKLSEEDKKNAKFNREIVTFCYNNVSIFTIPLVYVYFSGTKNFYMPSYEETMQQDIKPIEKELCYFLTPNDKHLFLKGNFNT